MRRNPRKVRPPAAKALSAPGTELTGVPKIDRGIPQTSSVIADTEKANPIVTAPERRLSAFGEQVERAIREGVRYLKGLQHPNGSWSDVENEAKTGTTSLIALALLTAGESPKSLRKTLEYLRGLGPNDLHSTYAVALQTMVFAAAEPERDQLRIANNVSWLEARSDQARRFRLLAGLVDLLRLKTRPAWRQLQHPVRAPRAFRCQ